MFGSKRLIIYVVVVVVVVLFNVQLSHKMQSFLSKALNLKGFISYKLSSDRLDSSSS